ncbi:MAG: F0F1 ATP synthase subunit A [Bdellovibrionales bacterium]|nr:F0F1 ATP synthase subunit A [Bdellovibrionales bacterium]
MIPGVEHHNTHVATAAVVTLGLVVLSVQGRLALGSGEKAVIPAGRLSIKGFFETLTEFIVSLTEMVLGPGHGHKYIPLFASIFTFILVNNLVGLIPGMTPATDNFNTTFAVGIFSFLAYNIIGIKAKGFKYIHDFLGHLPVTIWFIPLLILMFFIELVSHLFRPVSLGLRLAGNMTGDHAVLGVFLEILPSWMVYWLPMVFYVLGLLVCFIQAFVFTLLSMAYVMMAQAHDDH